MLQQRFVAFLVGLVLSATAFAQPKPVPDEIPRLTQDAASSDQKVAFAAVQRLLWPVPLDTTGLKAACANPDSPAGSFAGHAIGQLVASRQIDDRLRPNLMQRARVWGP